jgi:hypothetical protein
MAFDVGYGCFHVQQKRKTVVADGREIQQVHTDRVGTAFDETLSDKLPRRFRSDRS